MSFQNRFLYLQCVLLNLNDPITHNTHSTAMPDRSRIPRLISTFNSYIGNTSAHLAANSRENNATRLGLTEAEAARWAELYKEWKSLYLLYSDKTNSRTISVKNNLLLIIDKVVMFDRTNHILDRIASSGRATIEDAGVFRIKKGITAKKNHSKPQVSISEPVFAAFRQLGGGMMQVRCHSSSSNRASIYGNADCVQFLYCVGDTPPTSAGDAGLSKDLSSKAIFVLPTGAESSGKYLYIYFRWYNTRHPLLAGPWSGLQRALIL